MKLDFRRIIDIILRLYLGGTFIWASLDKIQHPHLFANMIAAYEILPHFVINVFALMLPWLELITGILVILGFWRHAALFIINSMLVVFIIAITQGLLRGLEFDCGCFSTKAGSNPISWGKVGEDFILLLSGLILWILPRYRLSPVENGET